MQKFLSRTVLAFSSVSLAGKFALGVKPVPMTKSERRAALEARLAKLKAQEAKEDHDMRKLPNSERLRLAEKQRLEGNDMFKAGSDSDSDTVYRGC